MATDYKRKVLKRDIIRLTAPVLLEDSEREILMDALKAIEAGEMSFIIGEGFIAQCGSPKARKRARVFKR